MKVQPEQPHELLARAREATGLGTRYVAEQIDVSAQMVSFYERGRREIPVYRVRQLADLYRHDLANRRLQLEQRCQELQRLELELKELKEETLGE